jgi:hypothetical protein
MSFRRMTRMISFRVSEHEFEQLRSKSEAEGARSVSDYARLSLCGGTATSDGQSEVKIRELSEGIRRLSGDIRRLFELIDSPQGARNGPQAMAAKQNGGVDA